MRKKLTKALLDGLRPDPAGDLLIWDTAHLGLGVRVSRGGAVAFIYQFSEGGDRRRRITLGRFGPLTLDQALRLAKKRGAEVADGRNPSREKREAVEAPTVADLCRRVLAEHFAKRSASSRRNAEQLYRLYLLPALGSRKVAVVKWEDIAAVHAALRDRPYQANRLLAACSIAWRCAVRWGWWPRDRPSPAADHDKLPERRDRGQSLTAEQLARLGAALRAEEGRITASAFTFALLTGCRPGEALAARWADIDLEARTWSLPTSKTGARMAYLGAPAVALLSALPLHSEYVFPGRAGGVMWDLKAVWRRLVAHAELPAGLRPYDATRHTYTSFGEEMGIEDAILRRLVGHTPGRDAHSRYTHGTRHLIAAADRVAGELDRLLSGRPGQESRVLAFPAGGA